MKVVIIGAGTCAMVVADILVKDRNFKLAGFIGTTSEEAKLKGKKLYGDVPFIGDRGILKKLREDNIVGFVSAIQNNALREKTYYEATKAGLTPINVISRDVVIEPSVDMGKGIVISSGCIVSHAASIADNTILESGVIIGINTKIGENCFLSAGCIIGGECDIRKNASFGMRSAALSYQKIGKNQIVEAGKIVAKSLPDLAREEFEE